MDCDKALLLPPAHDLIVEGIDWGIWPPRADRKDKNTYTEEHFQVGSKPKRELFMLCGLVKSVNEALRNHKGLACHGNANLDETYTIFDDPSDH
jgi:hypothetical protein